MTYDNSRSNNPLGMQLAPLGAGGYVLPSELCTERRRQYFERGQRLLGMYATVAVYSEHGHKAIEAKGLPDATPFKLGVGEFGLIADYATVRRLYRTAGGQFANQVFLALYGNFEALVFDLVLDATTAEGTADQEHEALDLLKSSHWESRFERIKGKLGVQLGKKARASGYRNIDMGFLGKTCTDPIDYLQRMADLRHRLVHSAGRADATLIAQYPEAGLSIGQPIELPFEIPFATYFFYIPLSRSIDEAFSAKYGWQRSVVDVHQLVPR